MLSLPWWTCWLDGGWHSRPGDAASVPSPGAAAHALVQQRVDARQQRERRHRRVPLGGSLLPRRFEEIQVFYARNKEYSHGVFILYAE